MQLLCCNNTNSLPRTADVVFSPNTVVFQPIAATDHAPPIVTHIICHTKPYLHSM